MSKKGYFKRLANHPGVPVATFMTFVFMVAALSNDKMSTEVGLIIGLSFSALIWSIVLLSNIK